MITAGIILGIRCSLENSKLESMTRATRLTLEDFNYVENVAFLLVVVMAYLIQHLLILSSAHSNLKVTLLAYSQGYVISWT